MTLLVTAVLTTSFSGPVQQRDIIETAARNPKLSTFVRMVRDAGLTDSLKANGPFTVFAPTDQAFASMKASVKKKLKNNQPALKSLLLYHVAQGTVRKAALTNGPVMSLNSESIRIFGGNRMRINDAKLVISDISASNGVIHVVDKVLIPPSMQKLSKP